MKLEYKGKILQIRHGKPVDEARIAVMAYDMGYGHAWVKERISEKWNKPIEKSNEDSYMRAIRKGE